MRTGTVRWTAAAILAVVFLACLFAGQLAPASYEAQFRTQPDAPPSLHYLLGTDELGRDRFSRLLYGGRISLLLAPLASLVGTAIAGVLGVLAGLLGGWVERAVHLIIDLFLSLPWLLLLLTVRAVLPLNVAPQTSLLITFALIALLGWAPGARVISAGARKLRESGFLLFARSQGCSPARLLMMQILPALRPLLLAQFWISIPLFLLGEANLSLLGLGVAEPLPSLGSMLRELESVSKIPSEPWIVAPAVALAMLLGCFHIVLSGNEELV